MSLFSWMKDRLFCDLAIDLGTANTLVFLKGKGIIVQEPSIVVVNKATGKVEAVGSRAKEMLGKTRRASWPSSPCATASSPTSRSHEKMLDYFIKKAMNNRGFLLRPRIVIGIPTGITRSSGGPSRTWPCGPRRRRSTSSSSRCRPRSAPTCPSPSRRQHDRRHRRRHDDIAVISLDGIVFNHSIRVAGNEMDDAVIHYLKKKYNLLIGERTAEIVKMQIGSAYPLDEPMTMEIKGRDLREGIPRTIVVDDQEIREAIGGDRGGHRQRHPHRPGADPRPSSRPTSSTGASS